MELAWHDAERRLRRLHGGVVVAELEFVDRHAGDAVGGRTGALAVVGVLIARVLQPYKPQRRVIKGVLMGGVLHLYGKGNGAHRESS